MGGEWVAGGGGPARCARAPPNKETGGGNAVCIRVRAAGEECPVSERRPVNKNPSRSPASSPRHPQGCPGGDSRRGLGSPAPAPEQASRAAAETHRRQGDRGAPAREQRPPINPNAVNVSVR